MSFAFRRNWAVLMALALIHISCIESKTKTSTPAELASMGLTLGDIAGFAQQLQIDDQKALISFTIQAPWTRGPWNPVNLFNGSFAPTGNPGLSLDYSIDVKTYENELVMGPSSLIWIYSNPSQVEQLITSDCQDGFVTGPLGAVLVISCVSQNIDANSFRELNGELRFALSQSLDHIKIQGEAEMSNLQLASHRFIDAEMDICLEFAIANNNPSGTIRQVLRDDVSGDVFVTIQYTFEGDANVNFEIFNAAGEAMKTHGSLNLDTGVISWGNSN